MNAVYLGAFSIGLSRSYYQKDSEANTKTIAKYQEYVTKVLSMIGEENPAQKAQELVDMERRIAKLIYTNEERRDPNITYNPVSIKELSSLVKGVNLPVYLSAVGVQTDRVIVPEILYPLSQRTTATTPYEQACFGHNQWALRGGLRQALCREVFPC